MLCHPVFRPLGRITYCAYLVHPTVIRIMLGNQRQAVYWNDNLVAMNTLGVLVISYKVAFFLSICLEFPITYLLQLISGHQMSELLRYGNNIVAHTRFPMCTETKDGPRLQFNMLELNMRK